MKWNVIVGLHLSINYDDDSIQKANEYVDCDIREVI